MSDPYRTVRPIDEHPIPFDQEEIDSVWDESDDPAMGDPPNVDEAHETYTETIAEYGEWVVFRPAYPFGHGDVTFWNGGLGTGFQVVDEAGEWHQLVNLFAEVVEQEGDCREAGYSSSLQQSSAYKQRCEGCGEWWLVG